MTDPLTLPTTRLLQLKGAWKIVRETNLTAKLGFIEAPPEILRAVAEAQTLQEAIEAWEAINYYNEAFFFAIQRIEDDVYKEMRAFSPSSSDRDLS